MRHVLSDRRYGCSVYPTIVLLTGAYTTNACWPQHFVHRLVDNGFHVLALDHRDFGRNAWTNAQYALTDMADYVLYTMAAHRIRSAHIYGVSMGGLIAMRMALSAPECCDSLSLLSTTPGRLWQEETVSPRSDNAERAMCTEFRLATEGDTLAARSARTDAFGDDASLHAAIVSRGYNTKSGHGSACQHAEALPPCRRGGEPRAREQLALLICDASVFASSRLRAIGPYHKWLTSTGARFVSRHTDSICKNTV